MLFSLGHSHPFTSQVASAASQSRALLWLMTIAFNPKTSAARPQASVFLANGYAASAHFYPSSGTMNMNCRY
jgi:hypothetical protein